MVMHPIRKPQPANPTKLTLPPDLHPLVVQTFKDLTSSQPDELGILYPRDKGSLNVTVSESSVTRSMLIMDKLVRTLESKGYCVETGTEWGRTTVTISGRKLGIRLREALEQHRVTEKDRKNHQHGLDAYLWRYRKVILTPSGRLAFTYGDDCRRTYDSRRRKLEDQIDSFVEKLSAFARQQVADEQALKARQAIGEQERLERLNREQEAQLTQNKLATLHEMARAFEKAARLRQFLAAVENRCSDAISSNPQVAGWLRWAHKHLDSIDPLSSPDKLINAVTRDDEADLGLAHQSANHN